MHPLVEKIWADPSDATWQPLDRLLLLTITPLTVKKYSIPFPAAFSESPCVWGHRPASILQLNWLGLIIRKLPMSHLRLFQVLGSLTGSFWFSGNIWTVVHLHHKLRMPPPNLFSRPQTSGLDQLRSRSSIDFSSSLRPEIVRSPASDQPSRISLHQVPEDSPPPPTPDSSSPTTTGTSTPGSHHKPSIVPKPPPSSADFPQVIQTVNKRSPFGAILSRTLPSYSGVHAVGVCDVEVPIPKQKFGYFEHKSMPSRGSGLTLDTVFFTLFYPAVRRETNCRVVWFPRSVSFFFVPLITMSISPIPPFIFFSPRPGNSFGRLILIDFLHFSSIMLFALCVVSLSLDRNTHSIWDRLRQTIDGFLKMANRTPNWMYRTVTCTSVSYLLFSSLLWTLAYINFGM